MQGKLYIYLDNIYTLSYMEVDIFQRFNFQRLDGLFRYKKKTFNKTANTILCLAKKKKNPS